MFSLIRAYKKYDPAATSSVEILLLYPGIKALVFHRLAHGLYKKKLYLLARMISEFSRFLTGIEIHPGSRIGKNLIIDHGSGIVIGETAVIGDNVIIFQGVALGSRRLGHMAPKLSVASTRRHPKIEDNVMIGAGAKILGGITIGQNACVGANAVVLEDVPPSTTMVGAPAKPIYKDSQVASQIMKQS
ncbi:MAG: serine O-acetyltransferase EpsC [Bacteriovoracia bacterium]